MIKLTIWLYFLDISFQVLSGKFKVAWIRMKNTNMCPISLIWACFSGWQYCKVPWLAQHVIWIAPKGPCTTATWYYAAHHPPRTTVYLRRPLCRPGPPASGRAKSLLLVLVLSFLFDGGGATVCHTFLHFWLGAKKYSKTYGHELDKVEGWKMKTSISHFQVQLWQPTSNGVSLKTHHFWPRALHERS